MGQSPQCRSCARTGILLFANFDLARSGTGSKEPEWARKSCECCVLDDTDMDHMVDVTDAVSSLPADPTTQLSARPDTDVVSIKSKRVPVHESNSLFRALTGKAEKHDNLFLYNVEKGDSFSTRAIVSRRVNLVDIASTDVCHVDHLKVNSQFVIDSKFTYITIVPDILSQLQRILIPVDKIEAISPGEYVLSDPLCSCLAASDTMKAVLIQYLDGCEGRKSVCFLLENRKRQQTFVKALTSIWHERQTNTVER